MLKSLTLKNFTAFSHVSLTFGRDLNVIVGENGLGKTHLLKLPYALLAVSAEEGQKNPSRRPTKAVLQPGIAQKLVGVFRPESLGRLTRRQRGRNRCEVDLTLSEEDGTSTQRSGAAGDRLKFHFATNSQTEVVTDIVPDRWSEWPPVFLPTRELLTLYPGLRAAYSSRYLEIEEAWLDACNLLEMPALRGPRERETGELMAPLERAMGGKVVLDRNGRFYLKSEGHGVFEMSLVAEGHRKFAMLAQLIANGSLLEHGYLFWDEPESNLNPLLARRMAESIARISRSGIQVFIATHSLFFLRELEILLGEAENDDIEHRWFALRRGQSTDGGVEVEQGASPDDVQTIASLDADLEQSDRFLRQA
jgi:predicted ATPase